ncbi:MAG TPA: type II secretion system F family protein [Solirubrobacteraceae bacterium]
MTRDTAALLLLLAVALLALAGVWLYVSTSARTAELVSRGHGGDEEGAARRALAGLDERLRRTRAGERLDGWLRSAGVKLSPLDYLLVAGGVVVLVWLLGRMFLSGSVALVAGLLVGILGTRAWVERRRAQRRDAFIGQLPELARILSNGTQAGLSMGGAVELAARELDDPAGAEMRTVLEEVRVGRALDEALEALRARLPSREVAVLMTTIVIQQRAGGDTVRALQELGATLDARKDLLREIRTLLSGSVFTSYVVAAIGIGTILLVNLINPGVLREMTSQPLGIVALVVAGVLWTVAFFMIRQVTRVQV